MEACCVVLDLATYPVNQNNDWGFLRGGYIRIRGRLAEVGCWNNRISLKGPDGSWDYIKGTDEERGEPQAQESWTSFEFDECSPHGDVVVSYLDDLTPQACVNGQVAGATRRTTHSASWSGRLFSLPIREYYSRGKPFNDGIVLCQTQAGLSHIYQRVGAFSVAGDAAINELRRRESEETILIL